MNKQPLTAGLALLALAIAIAIALSIAPGCQPMRNLDRFIWDGVGQSGATTSPGTPGSPADPPPIVEISAALLALGGFGGMARWISRAKSAANGRADELQTRLDRLEARVDTHNGHSHPDMT